MNTVFTPDSALIGGVLIGLAAVLTMGALGRIAGISGIISGILRPTRGDTSWRVAFLVGLAAAPLVYWAITGTKPAFTSQTPTWVMICAGILVGLGSRIGSGCTSGHGVCGVSRLSPRSIVATLTFMATAAITVFLFRHVVGGV